MMLFTYHDSSHEFAELTWVDSGISFFNQTFLQFYLSRVEWESSFIICFNLLSIKLSWSHNVSCEFNRLTWVIFFVFFNWLFFNFILYYWVYWKICFIIYFDLLFMRLLWSYDPIYKLTGKLELIRIDPIWCYLNIYKKISHFEYLF
jgi:hypothetical protein